MSGRQDLNLRPLGPQPSALPDYATPRISIKQIITVFPGVNQAFELATLPIGLHRDALLPRLRDHAPNSNQTSKLGVNSAKHNKTVFSNRVNLPHICEYNF